MKAREIRPGDELRDDSGTVYRVHEVHPPTENGDIKATVEYHDGGYGVRVWSPTAETPLVRP